MTRVTATQRRLLFGVVATSLLATACGLQQSGVDGVATARQIGGTTVNSDGTLSSGGTGTGGSSATGGGGSSGGSGALSGGSGGLSGGSGGGLGGGLTGTGSGAAGGSGTTGGAGTNTGGSSGGTGTSGGSSGLHGTITLGYLAVGGFTDLGKYFNVHVGDYGDPKAQVNAVANWVNNHGGIGGRRLQYDVREFNAQQSSASTEQSLCTTFAQDDHAFLVDLQGQIHPQTRDCYKSGHVIAVEGSNYGFSQQFYNSLDGWDLQPYFPTYDEAEAATVASLKARHWFGGDTKIGIVSWSDADYQHVVRDVLEPQLRTAGIKSFIWQQVSNSDAGAMQSGVNQAVTAFETQRVKRVMFVGSAPLQPFFFIAADSQHQKFLYGLNTFDDMLYEQFNNNPGEGGDQLPGAMGVSFFPVDDVDDNQLPFPQPGQEAQCAAIYKAAGITFPGGRINAKYSSKQAISYCEVTLLTKYIADHIKGPLTKDSFVAEYQRLGRKMQMASSYVSNFQPGHTEASAAYRPVTYNAGKKEWVFAGGNTAFP